MSVENVFLLPAIFFFRVPDQGFLACIIHHPQKDDRVKMNGCAALSSFRGWCIFHARKPRKIENPEEKNIAERRKKMHTSTFEKSRASPSETSPRRFWGTLAPVNFYKIVNMSCVNH